MNAKASLFLNLFFPKRCVGCGKAGEFVCVKCAGEIEIIKTATCSECGRINKLGQYCLGCKKKLDSVLTGLMISAKYDSGPTKEMIHHLKYSGFLELVPLLGELIVQRIKHKMPRGKIVIVPVPLHKKRRLVRGFNQAELIARYVSKKLHLSGGDSLVRIKNTDTQINLSKEMRIENLANAFICEDREFVNGKTVLLIDDVTTTGTTLNECAKILRDAGARQVWGVVVAKRIN